MSTILCESRGTERVGRLNALEKLFARIGQLSALPAVIPRVLQVAADGDSSAVDLQRVVEQDPTLSIRILRTVNSSYFAVRNEVADLQSAISLLGFVQVRNLALTVYVARLCDESFGYRTFSREGLWRHMVATGAIARLILRSCHRADPEEAYLTGLLHDVGRVLIEHYLPEPFRQVVDAAVAGQCPLAEERRLLSFDHADLGAYVAQQSGLPENTCRAIAFHHKPEKLQRRDREMLHVLVLANYFASGHGESSLGVAGRAKPPSDQVLRGLGLRRNQLSEIWAQLEPTLKSAEDLSAI